MMTHMTATPDNQAKVSANQNGAKVELKNIKHAKFASEETECFNATVYIDGKKEGEVSNEGHGGSNNYYPHSLYEKLKAIAATMPAMDLATLWGAKYAGQTMDHCPDTLIGDILNEELQKKELKRLCSRKTLFRIPSETYQEGEYRTINRKFDATIKAHILAKYPNAAILNETL